MTDSERLDTLARFVFRQFRILATEIVVLRTVIRTHNVCSQKELDLVMESASRSFKEQFPQSAGEMTMEEVWQALGAPGESKQDS